MKLAIVGPRDLKIGPSQIAEALSHLGIDPNDFEELVTGDAMGVDRAAIAYAKKQGMPWAAFGAGWGRLRKGAGPERNKRLVAHLDAEDILIAVKDSRETTGTNDTIGRASYYGTGVKVLVYRNHSWTPNSNPTEGINSCKK